MVAKMFRSIAAATMLVFVVLAASVALAQENYVSFGGVTFYSDKASYLPGETVTLTIEFQYPFTGTIILTVENPAGDVVYSPPADAQNIKEPTTKLVFTYQHSPADGIGTFKAKLAVSGVFHLPDNTTQTVQLGANVLTIQFIIVSQYVLVGQVVSETGEPIAGAKVTVVETGTTVYTANDGYFTVALPSAGTYTLSVKATGYMSNQTTVSVTTVGVTTLDEPIVLVSLETMIIKLQKQLNELRSQLNESVAQLSALIVDIQESLKELGDYVSGVAANLSATQSDVASLATSLENLAAKLDSVAEKLGALENTLRAEYATKSELAEAYKKLEDMVSTVRAEIKDLVDQVKNELSTRLAADEQKIEELSKAVDELNAKHDELKTKVDNLSGTVSNLQNVVLQQITQDLRKTIDTVNSVSQLSLIGIVVAVIGLIIAVVAVVLVYRKIVAQ